MLNFYYIEKEGNSARNNFLLCNVPFYKLSVVDFIISVRITKILRKCKAMSKILMPS